MTQETRERIGKLYAENKWNPDDEVARSFAAEVEKAKETKEEMERLNQLSKKIAEASTKIVYLQGQTKNEFGGVRDETAWNEIENELNTLLQMIFPDPVERSVWISNLEQTLPPRSV